MKDGSAIVRSISGIEVSQRSSDGYISATQLLKAHKAETGEVKKLADWMRSERAKGYIAFVSRQVGSPTSELIQQNHGSRNGSWIHGDLAVPFAAWLQTREKQAIRGSRNLVYLVETVDNQFLKIGITKNIHARLVVLQTNNPVEINLLFLVNGGAELESRLLAKFSGFRVRGEWFKHSDLIIKEFRSLDKYEGAA